MSLDGSEHVAGPYLIAPGDGGQRLAAPKGLIIGQSIEFSGDLFIQRGVGLGIPLVGRVEHAGELPDGVQDGGMLNHRGKRAPDQLLMTLGHFTADGDAALISGHDPEHIERPPDTMRRLEEHHRVSEAGRFLAPPGSRSPLGGRKPHEGEPRPTHAAHGERCQHSARAWNGLHRQRRCERSPHQLLTRVGQQRGACIGHERNVLALAQPVEQLRDTRGLVVPVEADHGGVDAAVGKEFAGPARILGSDQAGLTQDPKGPEGDVLEVADRGRHDVQTSGRRPGLHAAYCTLSDWADWPADSIHFSCERMRSAETLPHFAADYLAWRHEVQPTAATFDGVHVHDDLLEDFSRAAIDRQVRDLNGFARRLASMAVDSLSTTDRADHEALTASTQSRLYELEAIRTWERDPQLYGDTIATSLAAQAIFMHAPAAERARRLLSKLRQVPGVLDAARANVREPAGIFIKTASETLRGVVSFLDRDLPRALREVDDLSLLADLDDAATLAKAAIERYVRELEDDLAPRAKATFRLGKERLEQKLKLDEGVTLDTNALLRIAERELAAARDRFAEVAGKLGKGSPQDVWARVKAAHVEPGGLVTRVHEQCAALYTFLRDASIVSVPDADALVIAQTPPFYRWTFASLWAPGPLEARAHRSFYYVTDADPSWPQERQDEHMRDMNDAVLWAISMHEALPGHFLHFEHLRKIESPWRKATILAPLSVIEGWAHYAEHLVIEQGFAKKEPVIELGQLAENLIRLTRLIVGLRLHAEDLSVEQGVRLFRDDAMLEEGSARREAERGAFDPSYVVYALGKQMLLKLRRDTEASQGATFDLRRFHDEFLALGILPFKTRRRLTLGAADDGVVLA